jgi:hypothetical protein
MSDITKPIAFSELLQQCRRIEVPLIQRDYAQGREAEKDVRDDFLKALHGALSLTAGSPELPLNLDFIYGSMEGQDKKSFLPLDGQQRLTTLFLLHWYLAWRDGELPNFRTRLWDGKHARFTYGVRPSSTEFFDEIVGYEPAPAPENVLSVTNLVQDQPWFFLHWRLDPTIQSALTMLDAIHERFKGTRGLYARLVDHQQPVITFQSLPLEHFGLSDDLYIKMNARGKPLTAFETFKARFEELLKELFPTETRKVDGSDLSVPTFFALRMDTQWTDFFWGYKNNTHTFDEALMNLLWVLVRVSLNPGHPRFADDTTSLRNKFPPASYTHFHDRGWLTRDFAENVICLLEAWSKGGGKFTRQLPDTRYFDELGFFEHAIREPAGIEYTGLVKFAAFVFYLRQHEGSTQSEPQHEWARVIRNFADNTEIERPEEYGRCLAGLHKLLPHSHRILQRLAEMEIEPLGFSPQQVREEVLKAKLILLNPGWKPRILAAEQHGYFRGQIEFLLNFSGVSAQAEKVQVKDWEEQLHTDLQTAFDQYFKKAQLMFNQEGLIPVKAQLWKRALLVIGNYLLSFGRNYSFLTNPAKNGNSWKRFLRGPTEQRRHLRSLWDRLDANTPVELQLNQIIGGATNLEPWRAAIVKHPEVIDYCGQQEMRWEFGSDEFYLLKRRQMNGAHAELFSYALYLELMTDCVRKSLEPLKLDFYQSVTMTDFEPRVWLSLSCSQGRVGIALFSFHKRFQMQVAKSDLTNLPDVEAVLRNECGFVEDGAAFMRSSSREEIHDGLRQIASSLARLALSTP